MALPRYYFHIYDFDELIVEHSEGLDLRICNRLNEGVAVSSNLFCPSRIGKTKRPAVGNFGSSTSTVDRSLLCPLMK